MIITFIDKKKSMRMKGKEEYIETEGALVMSRLSTIFS